MTLPTLSSTQTIPRLAQMVLRAAPELSASVLFGVFRTLCSGKKHTGLVSDTRPLSVTNTDNRILAATVARAIMPAVLALVDPSQKGFLTARNGSEHTTDINTFFYEGVEKKIDLFAGHSKGF